MCRSSLGEFIQNAINHVDLVFVLSFILSFSVCLYLSLSQSLSLLLFRKLCKPNGIFCIAMIVAAVPNLFIWCCVPLTKPQTHLRMLCTLCILNVGYFFLLVLGVLKKIVRTWNQTTTKNWSGGWKRKKNGLNGFIT